MRRFNRLWVITVIALAVLTLAGCPDRPAPDQARKVSDRFCEALLAGDRPALDRLLTPTATGQLGSILPLTRDDQPVSCVTGKPRMTLLAAEVPIQVEVSGRRTATARLATIVLSIESRRGVGRILALRQSGSLAATGKGASLLAGPARNPVEVFSATQLPVMFTPAGAPQGVAFGVGRDRFSALAISPDSKRVGFVTPGVHAFLGVLDLGTRKARGIDLFFEGGGNLLAFSPDGRYLAVEVATAAGSDRTFIYDWAAGQRVGPDLAGRFPIESYHVRLEGWDSRNTLWVVVSGAQGRAGDVGGRRWALDPRRGTITERPAGK